ncbi:sugar-binding transcriptional regulator [Propionibacteriaceae bacterium Y1923]
MSPDSDVPRIMIDAARLYYEHGQTHAQIAAELGVSRIKVTRLLAQARAAGVVEISINAPDEPFADLAERLCERYGLRKAWIAPSLPEEDAARVAVDQAGAHAIEEVLATSALVAIGLSATLGRAIDRVAPREHPPGEPIGCVPMAGGWGGWQHGVNPGELAQRLGRRVHGRAYGFPAPLLAPSAEFATTLASLPEVQQAMELARSADTLLFGVGSLDWQTSQLQDSLSQAEREQLAARGAVGDIAARFFDQEGRGVDSAVDRRVLGLTLDDMLGVERRLLLAHGSPKLEAIRVALAAGMATDLCTDSMTARGLLR